MFKISKVSKMIKMLNHIPFSQHTFPSFTVEQNLDRNSCLASFFLVSLRVVLISSYNFLVRGHSKKCMHSSLAWHFSERSVTRPRPQNPLQHTLPSLALEHKLDAISSLTSFFLVSLTEALNSSYKKTIRGQAR